MKKRNKVASIILIVMLMCAAGTILTGCGSDSSNDPIVGTWQMSSVEAAGQEISTKDFLKASNSTETPIMIFKGDNTVSVDIMGSKGDGKWEVKDGKYKVTDDSDTALEFTLKDNKFSIEQSGASLNFAKKEAK